MKIRRILKNNIRALRMIGQTTPALLWVSVLQVGLAVVDPIFSIWGLQYFLNAVANATPLSEMLWVLGLIVGLWIVNICSNAWYNEWFRPRHVYRLQERQREQLYRRLSVCDIADYDKSESYESITKAMKELDTREIAVLDTVTQTLSEAIRLGTIIGLVVTSDVVVVLLSLLVFAVQFICSMRQNKVNYAAHLDRVREGRYVDYVHRIFYLKEHASDVRTTGLSGLLLRMQREAYARLKASHRRHAPRLALLGYLPGIVSYFVCGITILYAVLRIRSGMLSVGAFAAVLNAGGHIPHALTNLFLCIPRFQEHSLHLDDLYAVLDREPTLVAGDTPFAGDLETLEFRGVSFRYPGAESDVLHDLNFIVTKGEMIGIVGHNGAGKSTLIKLLCRLYDPTEGAILLNGIDLRAYRLADIRRAMGAVFQDYFVYPFDIRENITLSADTPMTTEAADALLADMGLATKLRDLSPDLTKPLSNEFENGIALSGGEAQKVAIARVLYSGCSLAVLDEPSSALDPMAESEIIDLVYRHFSGRTVFMISHRLSTTRTCARILHLDGGRLIECGTHDELMAAGGRYSEMYALQAEKYGA